MLGIAAELLEGIRLKVSEIGMLSQHGQLAAGKPAGFAFVVLRHAACLRERICRRALPP
jgi:hypothetical protein